MTASFHTTTLGEEERESTNAIQVQARTDMAESILASL